MEMNRSSVLEGLNEEQVKAVTCIQGPSLIVAGAGSGKTRVLTSRIAHILEEGADPSSILALTFTKKAANEMKERIALMVGRRQAGRLVMGTFHSVFIRFLREYAGFLGYPENFTIYDTSDSQSAVKVCVKEMGLDDKIYKPKDVLARISSAKNNLVTPTGYRNNSDLMLADVRSKHQRLCDLYERYQLKLKQSGVMDFDDILLNMNILFRDNPEALKTIASRFEYIMVDEYQDTNYSQYLILKKLAQFHHNICVVGDDSQSIYAFRGAKIENILNFKRDYPECKLFRLERNYRSTRVIVNAANSLIAHNEGRIPKNCYSDAEEGELIRLISSGSETEEAVMIVSAIMDRVRSDKAGYEDFAILYRTNSQSRALEEQLRRRNIPYMIYSGNSFFDRAEIKDMMAYFKLVVNPRDDESFRRIVNKPARGIGDTSLNALANAALTHKTSLFKAVELEDLEQFGLKPAAVGKIRSFCDMINALSQKLSTTDAYDLAREIADKSGLYALFKSDSSIEGQSRLANIDELLNSVMGFVEERQEEVEASGEDFSTLVFTLDDFLESAALLSNVDVEDEQDSTNKVSLMTVHSSKGLEYPYVFVAGMEENLFPSLSMTTSTRDLEEERRLFYVAVTRAKKAVSLSFATSRMRNGKHESNAPSRFISEIDKRYILNPLSKEDFISPTSSWSGASLRQRPGSPTPWGQSSRVSYERRPAPSPTRPTAAPRPSVIEGDFSGIPQESLGVGMRIEHNRFGAGQILDLSGSAPDMKARIRFDDYGEKLLLLKYAKLRKI